MHSKATAAALAAVLLAYTPPAEAGDQHPRFAEKLLKQAKQRQQQPVIRIAASWPSSEWPQFQPAEELREVATIGGFVFSAQLERPIEGGDDFWCDLVVTHADQPFGQGRIGDGGSSADGPFNPDRTSFPGDLFSLGRVSWETDVANDLVFRGEFLLHAASGEAVRVITAYVAWQPVAEFDHSFPESCFVGAELQHYPDLIEYYKR